MTRRALVQLLFASAASWSCKRVLRGVDAGDASSPAVAPLDVSTGAGANHVTPANPIDRIVILVRENRTYNAIFEDFPEGEPEEKHREPRCSDVIEEDDVPHGRDVALRAGSHLHCHHAAASVLTYHALARSFTLCARFFSEVRGPSFPNHLMLIAAVAPRHDDPRVPPEQWACPRYCYDVPTLVGQMEAAGKSWRAYDETGFVSPFGMIRKLVDSPNIVPASQFESDARAGVLPNLSYVFSTREQSDHPPYDLCSGQAWTLRQIRAVAEGPHWKSTAIFVLWDDWGGFHDHVQPPTVERDLEGRPLRYGYRVPCLVISPYARKGYLSMQPHSHLSVMRFVEDTFGLTPLNARVAEASGMSDCFDFAQAPTGAALPAPPTCGR
jgi:phospholipase C